MDKIFVDDWANKLTALLPVVFTLAIVLITYWQAKIADAKRKQDLFDRRWKYYCRMKKAFIDELFNSVKEKKQDQLQKYVDNYINHYADEAYFLFGFQIEKHVRSEALRIVKHLKGKRIEDPAMTFRKPFEKYLKI